MNNKNDEDQIRSRGELDDVGLPSCVVNLILGYGFFPANMVWMVVDIGCLECSVSTTVIAVCTNLERIGKP